MSVESLLWSAQDAHEAALMAESLEASGCRIQKTGGYYRDEASVYRTEIRNRQRDPNLDSNGKCPCCKK
jgi:hypothetical protein